MTAKTVAYIVQDYAGGKFWTVKAFDNLADAEAFAKTLGYKSRIKKVAA